MIRRSIAAAAVPFALALATAGCGDTDDAEDPGASSTSTSSEVGDAGASTSSLPDIYHEPDPIGGDDERTDAGSTGGDDSGEANPDAEETDR